jgi:hypothetical protein
MNKNNLNKKNGKLREKILDENRWDHDGYDQFYSN